MPGSTTVPGVAAPTTMTSATTLAATAVAARKDGFQLLATATRASAVPTLISARTATAIGEPTRGITTNGIANVADDRAERVRREQLAGARGDSGRVVVEERRRSREREAHDDRGREDDEQHRTHDRHRRLEDAARVEWAGVTDHEDQARERERGDDDLGDRDGPDRATDAGPQRREGRSSNRDPDQERAEDRS